ncbi:hypothetical protein TELCIR_02612 [Teladorsagia circumcincta]|uniref:Uncharacterized protein n=1 Tax=Teladorsagia circumcincta TaxID=45464 RepID=A0A2G9UYL0_TELCI|nr:hypothetical protein TELCIR_02612 [Teladorsagia circumcincta]
MTEKVLKTLYRMVRYWRKIHDLSERAYYGCNGVYKTEGNADKMQILCLFQNH